MSKIDQIKKDATLYDLPTTAQDISYSGNVSCATNVKDALDTLASGGGGTASVTPIYTITLGLRETTGNWAYSMPTRVHAGDVLDYYGCGTSGGFLVKFKTTRDGTETTLVSLSGSDTLTEGSLTFESDGFIRCQVFKAGAGSYDPSLTLHTSIARSRDIIVAASNTAASKKEFADFVCDGVNDEEELNNAIEHGLVESRTVVLLKGTYYLDSATKNYGSGTSNAFVLIDTSPSRGIVIRGEDPYNRAVIRLSNSTYEGMSASKQFSLIAVYNNSDYSGYVELSNIRVIMPSNQKQLVAIDMLYYGGWARLHSIATSGYISGYNNVTINLQNPPPVAVEGSIGIRFIGKGPNGSYGSEMTDISVAGFYEGISINTEWTVCNHAISYWCVYGWTFGHYKGGNVKSSTHPNVLINCGDERNVNLPYFYKPAHNIDTIDWKQDIEMIAFSIERVASATPGGQLGEMAQEQTPGLYRGSITYSTGQGSGNSGNIGFWKYGHGHNMRTTDMTHKQAGSTTERNTYRCNYLQRYYDTSYNKMIVCVDEQNKVWKDAMGNTVSNDEPTNT